MLRALEELGSEFERVALAPRRRRRRPRVLVLATAAGLLMLAAVALAASGILDGAPIKDPHVPRPRPHAGLGVPGARSAAILPLRVADPDGGPPWGMRRYETSREFGCVQVGRVVRGRIGALGQDGAFDEDGRFHELAAGDLRSYCEPLDGAGNLFVAVSYQGMPAAGPVDSCAFERHRPGLPACPAGDARVLYFGSLGPRARSVTFRGDDGRIQEQATGPGGAYLVVVRPRHGRLIRSHYSPGSSPGSGLLTVRYAGGEVCRLGSPKRRGGARPCPLRGYVSRPRRRVTRAQVRTAVQATLTRSARVPPSLPAGSRPQRTLRLTFRAPVASDSHAYYTATMRGHGGGPRCNGMTVASLTRDVAAGGRVVFRFSVDPVCPGPFRGAIRFRPEHRRPDPMPFTGFGGVLVDRYVVRGGRTGRGMPHRERGQERGR